MIKQVVLGSTGLSVSRIGLGTVKFGRNQEVRYPHPFELPSDQAIEELLAVAQESGINLLDTAPAYGTSEERLGKILLNKRDQWVISTKVGEEFVGGVSHFDFSAVGIQRSVERSLTRLNTDFLDIVLVHSNGDDSKIIEEFAVFDTLAALKKSGKIRAFGMSTKTVEGGKLTVDLSDIAMVTYNPLQAEEQPVIAHAHAQHKGIFIKKAFASGHLEKISRSDPVRVALQFIFQEPGVSSVIVGTLNKEHLRYAIGCAD